MNLARVALAEICQTGQVCLHSVNVAGHNQGFETSGCAGLEMKGADRHMKRFRQGPKESLIGRSSLGDGPNADLEDWPSVGEMRDPADFIA
jgi:hypothetical protein